MKTLGILILVLLCTPVSLRAEHLKNLSANSFDTGSTSNQFGRYGSSFSPDSLNNQFGAGESVHIRFAEQSLWEGVED